MTDSDPGPDDHRDDADRLSDLAPCGVLSMSADDRIIGVNRTFVELSGYEREELVGARDLTDLLSPGGRLYYETHCRPMLQLQGQVREIAFDLVRRDGVRLPVLVNAIQDRDDIGRPGVVRVAVFDATERRGYERELLLAKQRAEESEARAIDLARALEQTLLPPAPPSVAGLDIAARYRPAGTGHLVGGDFYDVYQVAGEEWVVVIGDVCGKGIEAGIVTSLARYTLREASVSESSPSRALARLNDALLAHGSDRHCTAAVLRLRRAADGWDAVVSCGGHPLPVLRHGGDPEALGRPGMLLGIFTEPTLHDTPVRLDSGDVLVLYTDGVTEGRRGDDLYGSERLHASVARRRGSADAIAAGLLEDALRFQSASPRDDIALVVLSVP